MPTKEEILESLCAQVLVDPVSERKDKAGVNRALNQIESWLEEPEESSEVIQIPGCGGVVRVTLEASGGRIHGTHVVFLAEGCQREFSV